MTDGIGIVGSTAGVTPSATAAAPVASRGAAANNSFAANVNVSIAPTPLLQNPRIVQDPSAGLITEYLNNAGTQVISQNPSEVTVSYLRQGLAADGLPKQANEPVSTTA